ncbi:MAG: redoxin domain-containing protein [Aurantibacter sp.]
MFIDHCAPMNMGLFKKDLIIKKLLVLLLVTTAITTACGDKKNKGSNEETTAISDNLLESKVDWPVPDSYVGGIPVYDKFEKLEPLFQLDNDTTYVINFWATWCQPCIKELPYFEELHVEHEDKLVKVILCSLDFPQHLETKLVPFAQKNQLRSEVVVLLDGSYNDWIDKVSPEWSGAIPATYIFKGDKKKLIGRPIQDTEELVEIVKPFL